MRYTSSGSHTLSKACIDDGILNHLVHRLDVGQDTSVLDRAIRLTILFAETEAAQSEMLRLGLQCKLCEVCESSLNSSTTMLAASALKSICDAPGGPLAVHRAGGSEHCPCRLRDVRSRGEELQYSLQALTAVLGAEIPFLRAGNWSCPSP